MKLERGDNNINVKLLQEKLGLEPIGNYGPKTEKAVKEFQQKYGLSVDGVVNDKTWQMIMGIALSKPSPPVAPPTPPSLPNTTNLKIDKLKGHIPDSVIAQIPTVITKFQINTPLRLAHFLSQCGHESGGFKIVNENLNYSAKGLTNTFKKYFPTETKAKEYERKPEKIANLVYGSRMGNGAETTGEGYKFRGRGYIQLTGKDNYKAFDAVVAESIVDNPDLVATTYPLASAAWFFTRCLPKCDLGNSDDVVTLVTKCVNGGTIGLADRLKHFKEYYALLA
jgi:putative chitinase